MGHRVVPRAPCDVVVMFLPGRPRHEPGYVRDPLPRGDRLQQQHEHVAARVAHHVVGELRRHPQLRGKQTLATDSLHRALVTPAPHEAVDEHRYAVLPVRGDRIREDQRGFLSAHRQVPGGVHPPQLQHRVLGVGHQEDRLEALARGRRRVVQGPDVRRQVPVSLVDVVEGILAHLVGAAHLEGDNRVSDPVKVSERRRGYEPGDGREGAREDPRGEHGVQREVRLARGRPVVAPVGK